MKTKFLSVILLTAILLVTMASITLAATDFSITTSPTSLTKTVKETSFTITASDDITINVPEFADISDGDGHTIVLSQDKSGNIAISAGNSTTVTISWTSLSPTGTDLEDLALGTFSRSIVVTDGTDNETITVQFISSFCDIGNVEEPIDEGKRKLEIVRVRDKSSDEDWEWKPLDEVEVEVKVKFESDDENDDIDAVIEVALYDSEEKDFVDLEDEDELEREVSLDEGESLTESFIVKVPVEDVEDSSGRYKLYVKVYEDGDEDVVCVDKADSDYYQDIRIEKESYEVIVDDIEVTTPAPCGEEVQVSARVYNIGNHEEDRVKVTLYNRDLGINMESESFSLDEGDSKRVFFNFIVPDGTEEKSYILKLHASYRYRSSTEIYREESDVEDAALKVEGNCEIEKDLGASITAELDSDVIAGEQLVVKGTIRNTGAEETTYNIDVTGHSSWAELENIDPETITLDAGKSKNFFIYLNIDEDAEGEQFFTIEASYDGETTEQEVSIVLEEAKAAGITGATISEHLSKNWFIWVIVAINIILIIAIILVARRIVTTR